MILCGNPSAQFKAYQKEIEAAVLRVMRGDRFILGQEVSSLEDEFAEYIGVKYAIGVANGTDALEIALRSLDIGVEDEVITVSHTAVATVAAIEAVGARPVLVDVDPNYYTINPFQLSEVLTSKTKAIIAVHLYGQSADLGIISEFCKRNGIFLIEDVSQAHGAKFNGRRLGSIGDIGCFSCYPTKNLGAIGDAGLITTNKSYLNLNIRKIRQYGWANHYISEIVGRNSRLDELQAAVLRVKLRHLDESNRKRCLLAAEYDFHLREQSFLCLPQIRSGAEAVFHLYVVRSKNRDELSALLKSKEIYPGIHYPIPIHLQPAYRNRIKVADTMAVTEQLANEVLSLPIYPELDKDSLKIIVDTIKSFIVEDSS
jgi:dTDP-4-amino-4,6-dideoxygalactose transaminase